MSERKLEYFAEIAMQAGGKPALWKIKAYTTSGINFPIESNERYATKAEAAAIAARMNAGENIELSFASYSDD